MGEQSVSASPNALHEDPAQTEGLGKAVRGTLPLLMITGALFFVSVVFFAYYRNVGPRDFPLWGLLLTLGFVSAIGSSVSVFFAAEDEEPESTGEGSIPSTGESRSDRDEFGRPKPDLVDPGPGSPTVGPVTPRVPGRAAEVQPWSEDTLPPAVLRGPRPVLTTLDDPGDISRALEEIAEIQRQLVARAPATPARPEPSAGS
jgi:hypothetical protein